MNNLQDLNGNLTDLGKRILKDHNIYNNIEIIFTNDWEVLYQEQDINHPVFYVGPVPEVQL